MQIERLSNPSLILCRHTILYFVQNYAKFTEVVYITQIHKTTPKPYKRKQVTKKTKNKKQKASTKAHPCLSHSTNIG